MPTSLKLYWMSSRRNKTVWLNSPFYIYLHDFLDQIVHSSFMEIFWSKLPLVKEFYNVQRLESTWIASRVEHSYIYFYFLLPISRESIVFGSSFRNGHLDELTRFEVPWIRKSHFQRLVCVCVCVSVISISQKQIAAEYSNLVFYICIMYRRYLMLFMKIGQKLCVQGHTKEF